jgi:hypothetical protein
MGRPIHARTVGLAVYSAMILAVLASVGANQAATPTTAPTTVPATSPGELAAKALTEYIQIIKTDKDPSVVLRAFTRACSLDRLNTDLNSAYMRRMLLMGRPRAAYMSARILSSQDADAALAWALVGYTMGRSNKYLDSLTATARALEFNSDDPSILNNAGQLAAWFDNAPAPPKLGDREKRVMDKLKDKFQNSKAYQSAYARINSVYVDNKANRATLEAKLTTAQAKYSETRTEELTLRADIKRINTQILQQNKKLDYLYEELRRNENRLNVIDENGRRVYNQRTILKENTRIEKEIDTEKEKKEELRKEGTPIVPKIRLATALGKKLRKEISAYRTALKGIRPTILRQLRWDPPAVDGVFTPESTKLPQKIKHTTTRPIGKVSVSSSEAAASKKLKMAKLYASNKRYQRAREIILEIVDKYPKTESAAKAKELRESISLKSDAP